MGDTDIDTDTDNDTDNDNDTILAAHSFSHPWLYQASKDTVTRIKVSILSIYMISVSRTVLYVRVLSHTA